MIAILLPLICFTLILLILSHRREALWRENFLLASLLFCLIVFIGTELLSLLSQINYVAFVSFWMLVLLMTAGISFNLLRKVSTVLSVNIKELSRVELTYIISVSLISIVLFILALVYPANTHDAMTYHLSRVGNWIENQSVAFYATNDLRQLTYGPLAGYFQLHVLVLSGHDVFLNCIQFFAMLSAALAISLLAKKFGADRGGQIIAAVFLITLPMGIIQASSTQNDYVLSYFLIVFIYFLYKSVMDSRPINMLAAGAALGFCFLTKATAYLMAFPFLVWYLFKQFQDSKILLFKKIFIIVLSAVLLNVVHYSRNISLCGHPLTCPQLGAKTKNTAVTLPILISNITRNMALQWSSPFTRINDSVTKAVEGVHKLLKLDINDPRSTYEQTDFVITDYVFDEDFAGNFLHHILIIILLFAVLIKAREPQNKMLLEYALIIISIFLLFNLYLKWQPWGNRLFLPLFVLCSALIGIKLAGLKNNKLSTIIVLMLLVASIPWVIFNQTRPLIAEKNPFNTPYAKRYYLSQPDYEKSYTNAVKTIDASHCKKIGLHLQFNSWEFPLWFFLQKNKNKNYEIRSVGIDNISSRLEQKDFKPCLIVDNVDLNRSLKDILTINKKDYILIRRMSVLNIFKPK